MRQRYKITDVERSAVLKEMRDVMIEQAKLRQTITYGDLALRLSVYLAPRSFVFSQLLREIGREEDAAGRGSLPAVVVRKSTGIPGGGYFRGVGGVGGVGEAGREVSEEQMEAIWRADLEFVFDYWQNQT